MARLNLKNFTDELKKKLYNFTNYTVPQTAARVASNPKLNKTANTIQRGRRRVADTPRSQHNFLNVMRTPNVTGVKPIDYTANRIGNYIENTYIAGARDLPKALKGIARPESYDIMGKQTTPNQTRLLNVGRAGFDVLRAIPDPTDIAFAGYDYLKGVSAAKNQGLKGRDVTDYGVKSVTLEKPTGLGEAVTKKEGGLRTALDVAELPLLLAGGVIKGKFDAKKMAKMENELKQGLSLIDNYKEFNPEYQMAALKRLDEIAEKINPRLALRKNKELRNLYNQGADKYFSFMRGIFDDGLYSAKNPKLRIGMGAEELKNTKKSAQAGLYDQPLYHGTSKDFSKFDASKSSRGNYWGEGLYLTPSKTEAGFYGSQKIVGNDAEINKLVKDWDVANKKYGGDSKQANAIASKIKELGDNLKSTTNPVIKEYRLKPDAKVITKTFTSDAITDPQLANQLRKQGYDVAILDVADNKEVLVLNKDAIIPVETPVGNISRRSGLKNYPEGVEGVNPSRGFSSGKNVAQEPPFRLQFLKRERGKYAQGSKRWQSFTDEINKLEKNVAQQPSGKAGLYDVNSLAKQSKDVKAFAQKIVDRGEIRPYKTGEFIGNVANHDAKKALYFDNKFVEFVPTGLKDEKKYLVDVLQKKSGLVEAFNQSINLPQQPTTKAGLYDTKLLEEARKYKSADDFVKAQEKNSLFHGTLDKEFKLEGDKPLFLTDSFDSANTYAGYRYDQKAEGKVIKYFKNKGRTLDLNNSKIADTYLQKIAPKDVAGSTKVIENARNKYPNISFGKGADPYDVLSEMQDLNVPRDESIRIFNALKDTKPSSRQDIYKNWDKIIEQAKKDGYDFIAHTTEDPSASITFPEIVAINPSKSLQTKSQLTEIWNQAKNVAQQPLDDASKFKDIASFKESLSPKNLKQVEEYESLIHKRNALDKSTGYKPFKLSAKEKARFTELDAKYRPFFFQKAQQPMSVTKSGGNTPGAEKILGGNKISMGFVPSSSTRTQPSQLSQTPQKIRTERQVSSEDIITQGRKQIGSTQDKPSKSFKQVASDLYTQWVDRYNPITKASEKAKSFLKTEGAELRPEADPSVLVRKLTGAGGIADNKYQTELKPVIDQLDELGIEKLDMDVYLANKRLAGFGEIGRDVKGNDPAKAKQIVDALETKYGADISQIADQLYKYQDAGFEEMIKAGFISPETAKIIRSQNPDYAPLNRVMDEMDNYLGIPTRKTMQGTQPIKKLKGSERQIESPLENIIGNTFKQRAAIEKNDVAKGITSLQQITDLGFKKVSKAGEDTITVWNNGNKEYWKVGEEIATTAKGLSEENMNGLLKIFKAPASLLRQGATGRNPDFMIPNVIRDQLDAGITSKYGYIPFVDYLSGLKSMVTNDEIYQKWQKSGAKIDLGEMSGRKTIQKSFDNTKQKRRLFGWLSKSLDVMGKYSEQPTRVGLFKKAYKKTGNELLSMMESRDATVDFARMGSKMKVANSIIPFLNVGVQGFDKLIRSVKDHPGKVALNATMYGAFPAVMTTLYNLTNHADEYAEIPQYEKDSNFILVGGRNENGTVDYLTIPKGNVLPVISNPIQSFLEFAHDNSQQTFGEFATQFLSSTLPVVGDGQSLKEVGLKTVGGNLPQLVKPITENLINKSFWKYNTKTEQSKEIVPSYLQKKAPYKQSYEWTPRGYKAIGAVLNVSPLQVQNLMEGYLAGYTKIPNQIIDGLFRISKGQDVETNQKPILRRFIKETYPSSGTKQAKQVKSPGFMERVTGDVSADTGQLPTNDNDFKVLYEDATRTIEGYKDTSSKIRTGLKDTQTLDEAQQELVEAQRIVKQMEAQEPERVYKIGLEVYESGGGKTTEERAAWAAEWLGKAKDEKQYDEWYQQMLDSKVMTKSVLEALREQGLDLNKYVEGGKVKTYGGSGKKGTKIKFPTTKLTAPTIKVSARRYQMPKLNFATPSTTSNKGIKRKFTIKA